MVVIRSLCWLLALLVCIVQGDADFLDVKTGNVRKDRSGKGGDPVDKYFHESTFHPHYDGRFADKEVPKDVRLSHLTALMQTYLATMRDIGAETWIMHGTLLGWWWNQKVRMSAGRLGVNQALMQIQILPWDSDLDVQVSEPTMYFLAKYYNMTEFHYELEGVDGGRTYLMEINPHFVNGSTKDHLNMIDARWIDTDSGLFIDISTVRKNYTAIEEGIEDALMVKDRHHYRGKELFPLRDSFFEGIHVKIPFDYSWLLEEEYGRKALTLQKFEG
ncbi:putative mannosylphosphorylation protein [Phaeomoniella chlamydospora]|uniref:Putative mannosylphosphorylation protein n=1 Tax=Phaeomoniella chlamydospora TaxID=158046 RepID=A0A0G2G2A9_PHACM|nr:putative mannosylphosphorylation protein [Phaeomoniella chlamydospora]